MYLLFKEHVPFQPMRTLLRRYCSTAAASVSTPSISVTSTLSGVYKKMHAYFLQPTVYSLLQKLMITNPDVVHTRELQKPTNPQIRLVTQNQLEKMQTSGQFLTRQRLQMPPIIEPMQDKSLDELTIHNEPLLNQIFPEGQRMVFVDISLSHSTATRPVVVRERDGLLRHATWQERSRLLHTYFPLPCRKPYTPTMFLPEPLKNMMQRGRFTYILDRACIQFEAWHPVYVHTCARVYEYLLDTNNEPLNSKLTHLNQLRATRHYGGLALYATLHRRIGLLLADMMQSGAHASVACLLKLYELMHPNSAFTETLSRKKMNWPTAFTGIESGRELDVSHQVPDILPKEDVDCLLTVLATFMETEASFVSPEVAAFIETLSMKDKVLQP